MRTSVVLIALAAILFIVADALAISFVYPLAILAVIVVLWLLVKLIKRLRVRRANRKLGDMLEEAGSGGDLCIQACANDPQVAVHAIRNLSRIAFGRAAFLFDLLTRHA